MAVTPEMIAVALGRAAPSATEGPQWQMWIDDALMLIEARRESLNVPGPLDPEKLDYVVRESVVAQVRRPDDATQVTVSVQDASTSRLYSSSRGRVTILDEWWVLLGLTAPDGGAFSIDTVSCGSAHDVMCSLNFGATYCSCGTDIAGYPIYGCDP